jgi:hypothetical protein
MRFPWSTIQGYVAAMSGFSIAAIVGIARRPQLGQAAPVATSEIVLAALGIALLMIFGIILALIWNRLNARARGE